MNRQTWAVLVLRSALTTLALTAPSRAEDEATFHAYGARFVGQWTRVDPGQSQKHHYRWTLGQRFVEFADSTAQPSNWGLIGIDPATGKRAWWDFYADGTMGASATTEAQKEPNVFAGTVDSGDGKSKGTYEEKRTGPDRAEFRLDMIVNGKQIAGTQIWERKPSDDFPTFTADPPAEIPAGMSLLAKLTDYPVCEGDGFAGGKFTMGISTKWVLGGKFLRCSGSYVGENQSVGSYQFILGVDSATGLATGWEFDSDGWVGKFVMAADGKSLEGSVRNPKGEVMKYTGTFTFNPDGTLTYKASGKTGDAPPKPYGWVYHKLPKR